MGTSPGSKTGFLYTPTATSAILKDHDIRLTKKFGQHFLVDGNILRNITQAADIQPDEQVLEVGPGIGSLTEMLLAAGARVTAVEIDKRFIPLLESKFRNDLNLVNKDAMKVEPEDLPVKPAKMVANLPYNIAVPLLIKTMVHFPSLHTWVVTVQKEIAERLLSKPRRKSYGGASVKVQRFCTGKKLFNIPPGAFMPPPKVESAVLFLSRQEANNVESGELAFIDLAFSNKRKLMINNLAGKYNRQVMRDAFRKLGITPNARAEELAPDDFRSLFQMLSERS